MLNTASVFFIKTEMERNKYGHKTPKSAFKKCIYVSALIPSENHTPCQEVERV